MCAAYLMKRAFQIMDGSFHCHKFHPWKYIILLHFNIGSLPGH
jgi:hypothetical protein